MEAIYKKFGGLVVAIVMLWSSASYAQGIAVSGRISTLGLGIEVTKSLTETINARVGGNYFSFSSDGTVDEIDYERDINLLSALVSADWFPFEGGFRMSGGLLFNGNGLDSTAKPAVEFNIGGIVYPSVQVGTLTGEMSFREFAPYLGVGWGNAVGEDKKFGFVFDLGIVFQGSPDVDLSASGLIALDPTFQRDLAEEEKNLEKEYEDFKYYPIISFGNTYQF